MAWITDLRHFLNEDGSIADASKQARKLSTYFGSIVKGVTSRLGGELATGVRCRKRFGRRPCPGEIIAYVNQQDGICWSCPVCEETGIISGWKGTSYDWSVNA